MQRRQCHHLAPAILLVLGILALAILSAGCASAPKTAGGVRIVSENEIEPLPADAEDRAIDGAGDAPAVETVGEEPGEPLVEEAQPTLTTTEALARAIDWTAEGLRLYDRGDFAGARTSLGDARIVLLDADLPEVVQEAGLAGLTSYLPAELRHHDVTAVIEEVVLRTAGEELPEHLYIAGEVRRILRRFGAPAPDDAYMATVVSEVEQYVRYYQGRGREFFERSYQRKHKYWPTIRTIFEARGIPEEMGYMAFVESGFNPLARSHAGARGLWQFIKSTGRSYRLRTYDDFHDVTKSTEAASEYLLDLIGLFGSQSFLLATAAYNAGEGRIGTCLRRLDDPFKGRTFWAIRPCLARETQEYVPRILAAAVVSSDPGRFGFDLRTEEEMRQSYDVVTIPSPTSLQAIAERSGVTVADLRTVNTDLASNARSTPARNFPLYIPHGGGDRLTRTLAADPRAPVVRNVGQAEAETAPPARRPGSSTAPFEYEARRGDTLAEIAAEFGVSVDQLRDWNPFLRQRVLFRGDRLKIHPAEGSVERVTYRVRSGDTLSGIASRHGVSYRDLARWNDVPAPYRLRVGQRLVIYPRGATVSRLVYTVKKGNTLASIASVFAVRYRDIMSWNDLDRAYLRVGQKLSIQPSQPMRAESYTVRRGDTAAKIARRYGVSVRDVLTPNGLGGRTVIRPGQRLVVYVPQ